MEGSSNNSTFFKWGCGCITGAIVTVVVLVVGGIWWGVGMYLGQAQTAVENNPVVIEHIGVIQDFDLDLTATGELPDDIFEFDIKGSKANGTVQLATEGDGPDSERIVQGKLILDSGEEFDLMDVEIKESPAAGESPIPDTSATPLSPEP
jgi:hypothetical protein